MRRRGRTLHQQIMREAAAAGRRTLRMPYDTWVCVVDCPHCHGSDLAFNERSTSRKCRECGSSVTIASVREVIREELERKKSAELRIGDVFRCSFGSSTQGPADARHVVKSVAE